MRRAVTAREERTREQQNNTMATAEVGRTDGARTVRTVLLVGMRTNGAAPLAGEGGEREKRHIDQPNASPSHAWLDAREIRRMCGES